MNFEFIPCVLKHTEGSPVYGLLIRPVNGASGTGVQNPNISPQVPAVPVQGRATSSGDILQIPRSSTQLHLVPSQQPTPILPAVSGNKVLLPPNTNLTTVASPTTNYQFGVHGHGNKPQVPSAAPCLLSPPIHPVEFGQHKSGFNSPAFVSAAGGVPTTLHQHYEQSRPETQSVQVVPQMASSSKGGYHGLETPPAGHHPQHQPVMTNFQGEGMGSSTASRPCFPPQQNSHSGNERGGYFHGQQPVTGGGGGGSVELTSLLEDIDTRDLAEFGRILAESESILSTDALLDGSVSEASLPNADRSHSSQYNNYDSASTNFSHANSYSSNFHSVVPLPSSAAPTPTAVRQPCRFQGEQRPVGEKSHNVNLGAPRPQLDWERAPAETAGTPDSGIQSITGSPHGAGQSPNLSPLMRHSTHFAGCYSLHSRLQNPLPQSGEKSNVNLVSDIQKLPATVSDKDVDSAKKLKIDKIRKGNTNRGETTENSSKNKEKKCGEFADMPTLVPELSAESSSADSESGNKRKRKHEPSAIADGDSAVNLASVGVNICDKVSCMDEKFNKVCLQVLKGEKPVETLGNWKPSEGDFPRSPFQESHPNSADRSALVDKLLSTLQPDQLQLFSRLFDAAKLKKSVVVEKKMKKQNGKKSKRSVSRGSDGNRNKSDISSAEPEENLSGYLSDTSSSISTPSENRSASPASSFAPPTPSVEQGTNKFSADLSKDAVLQDLSASQERCKESASDQKGPHTVSLREKRMLMKLKEFRSRARNIIDPSLIEHVLDLAAKLQNLQLSDTDTARVKKIGDPCFRVRWERIKLRKERLERLQHCEKMKSFDNLRNLEKEAESSDEESGESVTKVDGETEREKMVEIKDSPERGTISLRIRLGALCPKVSEALLPPKKRIKQQQNQNILSEDAKPKSSSVELTPADANLDDEKDKNKSKVPDAGTQNQTKVKKRRRNRLYPWDRVRQRRKQRLIGRGVFRRCKLCKAWLRIQDFVERDAETGETSRLCSNCTQSLHLEQTEVSKPPAELKPADQMKQCRVILRKLPSKIGKNRRESSTDDSSGIELDGDKTYSKPRKKYRRPGEVGDTLSRKESSDMGSACDEVNLPNKYFNGAFRLPYDLWWDFYYYPRNPSSNFTLTRSNINVDQPPKSTQPNVCTCRIPEVEGAGACVDNCLNRMMFTECRSGWCPCGDVCQNQRFQKHQWIKGLKKFDTNTERGCGVNTEHEIFKG